VIYSDRLIPSRLTSNLADALHMIDTNMDQSKRTSTSTSAGGRENQEILNDLLRSELLGQPNNAGSFGTESEASFFKDGSIGSPGRPRHSSSGSNMLKYMSPHKRGGSGAGSATPTPGGGEGMSLLASSPVSALSPAPANRIGLSGSSASQKRQQVRKIPRKPYKILEAPNLHDDYYLNLVDWSHANVVAVALGACVYLWSAHTAKVRRARHLVDHSNISYVIICAALTQR
jgi:cell division cycle 20-like protein 1 (cofactor of APC complex)